MRAFDWRAFEIRCQSNWTARYNWSKVWWAFRDRCLDVNSRQICFNMFEHWFGSELFLRELRRTGIWSTIAEHRWNATVHSSNCVLGLFNPNRNTSNWCYNVGFVKVSNELQLASWSLKLSLGLDSWVSMYKWLVVRLSRTTLASFMLSIYSLSYTAHIIDYTYIC